MKKLTLTENQLTEIVSQIIKEQSRNLDRVKSTSTSTDEELVELKKIHSDIKEELGKSRSKNPIYTDDELKIIADYLTRRIKRVRDGEPNSDYSSMRKALHGKEKILLPSLELMTAITDSLNLK